MRKQVGCVHCRTPMELRISRWIWVCPRCGYERPYVKTIDSGRRRRTHIYALVDPHTGQVRYVGQTTRSLRARLYEHLEECHLQKRLTAKDIWIYKLYRENKAPKIVPLESVDSGERDMAERRWIAHYRMRGADLFNVTVGGCTMTPVEQRVRIQQQTVLTLYDDASLRRDRDSGPVMAYFNGGCHGNPIGYACGGWFVEPYPSLPRLKDGAKGGKCYAIGEGAMNTIAEYNAALDALRAVYGHGYKGAVRLHGDSERVVFQYNRKYRCKAPTLQELLAHLRKAVTYFKSVEVVWEPRERNAIADEQSRLAYEAARKS